MREPGRVAEVRAVPERFGWALRVLLVAAALYGLICVGTLVVQVVQLVVWVQPGAQVPLTMDVSVALPTNGMHNHYSGGPFVSDGTAVTATRIVTTLDDVPFMSRVMIGVAPVLSTLTTLAVTVLLGIAIRRLGGGVPFGRDAARPVIIAAAVLAVGTTVTDIAEGCSYLGFGEFAWGAPGDLSRSIARVGGFTFEFAPLFAACGLLVVAVVLRRGLALQSDVEGLV